MQILGPNLHHSYQLCIEHAQKNNLNNIVLICISFCFPVVSGERSLNLGAVNSGFPASSPGLSGSGQGFEWSSPLSLEGNCPTISHRPSLQTGAGHMCPVLMGWGSTMNLWTFCKVELKANLSPK